MSKEQGPNERPDDASHLPLQADLYGLKLRPEPTPADEPTPKTWRELRRAVGDKFRGIVLHAVGVVEDTVRSVRSLVRGIGALGKLPDAVARRIGRAHAIVDSREDQKSEEAKSLSPPKETPELENARQVVRRLEAKGIVVQKITLSSGVEAIAVVPKALLEQAKTIAQTEVKQLSADPVPNQPNPTTSPSDASSDSPIANLPLSKRTKKALVDAGITTVVALRATPEHALGKIPGIGPKSCAQIREVLARHATAIPS